jgi:hypothetical protein
VPYVSADRGSLKAAQAALAATEVGRRRKQRAAWQAAGVVAARTQQAAWEAPWDVPEAEKAGWGGPWALHKDTARASERLVQASLLRCIFGNPFRPVAIEPAWLRWQDGTLRHLARSTYQERTLPAGTFDTGRLAVLADALEEAGCTDADLLAHCRGPGPHARGCWPVDLILGKE